MHLLIILERGCSVIDRKKVQGSVTLLHDMFSPKAVGIGLSYPTPWYFSKGKLILGSIILLNDIFPKGISTGHSYTTPWYFPKAD